MGSCFLLKLGLFLHHLLYELDRVPVHAPCSRLLDECRRGHALQVLPLWVLDGNGFSFRSEQLRVAPGAVLSKGGIDVDEDSVRVRSINELEAQRRLGRLRVGTWRV